MQPLGYTSLTEEQKARAAALGVARELLVDDDLSLLIGAATFILDGTGSYVVFTQSLSGDEEEEFVELTDGGGSIISEKVLFKGERRD